MISTFFSTVAASFRAVLNTLGWRDLVDVALLTAIVYAVIKLVRQTRALQLLKGILLLLLAYFLAIQLNLKAVRYLMDNVLQIGLIAMVIVFQPELRRALEQVGRGKLSKVLFSGRSQTEEYELWHEPLSALCDSVEHMSNDRTGALIVVERVTRLGDIVNTGTRVDGRISPELLETIFYEGSPLHDGAVVIRDAQVAAAGCLLPLTSVSDIARDMGTRHRAAIGMSENSDALVVVVSEETGIVSLAKDGVIIRRLDKSNLFRILSNELIPEPEAKKNEPFWKRLKP